MIEQAQKEAIQSVLTDIGQDYILIHTKADGTHEVSDFSDAEVLMASLRRVESQRNFERSRARAHEKVQKWEQAQQAARDKVDRRTVSKKLLDDLPRRGRNA